MMDSNKLRLVIMVGFLCYIGSLWALADDAKQQIIIVAQEQSMELKDHKIVFKGQVVIHQGSIVIHADRVVVTRLNNQPGYEKVEANGSPTTFFQELDHQKKISGRGGYLQYDAQQGIVILQQQAQLTMGDNQLQSERIIYDLKKQSVQADRQVKMVLMPEQRQQPANLAR